MDGKPRWRNDKDGIRGKRANCKAVSRGTEQEAISCVLPWFLHVLPTILGVNI